MVVQPALSAALVTQVNFHPGNVSTEADSAELYTGANPPPSVRKLVLCP